jgi:cytoskeletal protein CcmA (bactofilin family)
MEAKEGALDITLKERHLEMFQQNRGKNSKDGASNKGGNSVTIISEGCEFSGRLFCRGASRIGGKIEGTIISEGSLIIEETAEVKADIESDEIVVRGKISGTLKAAKRVELFERAEFTGEMTTPALVIHEGAALNGTTTMKTTPIEVSTSTTDWAQSAKSKRAAASVAVNLI